MDWHLCVPVHVVVVLHVPSSSTDRDFDCQISLSRWLKWCTLTGGCQARAEAQRWGFRAGGIEPPSLPPARGVWRSAVSSPVRSGSDEVGLGASWGFKNPVLTANVDFAFMLGVTVCGPVGLKSLQEGPKPEQVGGGAEPPHFNHSPRQVLSTRAFVSRSGLTP